MGTHTSLGNKLLSLVRGTVHDDPVTLRRFATDQSIYEIVPRAVVIPSCEEDVIRLAAFCHDQGIPLTARGRGSGTAGAGLGEGIVLAFARSEHFRDIGSFEHDGHRCTVSAQAGVLHERLQAFLRGRGYFLPADPSSGAISVIGGNVATKASGPHAFRHGSIDRYLESVRLVLADGTVVDTADPGSIPSSLATALQRIGSDIERDEATRMLLESRNEAKIASGYNLFGFLRHREPGGIITQLAAGSVGTLGMVTRATLRGEPVSDARAAALLFFESLREAGEAVQQFVPLDIAAIELMNATCLEIMRKKSAVPIPQQARTVLLIECTGPSRQDTLDRIAGIVGSRGFRLAAPLIVVRDAQEQSGLWKIRKALLPSLRGWHPDRPPLSVVNDVGVPVEHLAAFIADVERLMEELSLEAAVYGHAGSGNLHLRPFFDPAESRYPGVIREVADRVYEAVFRYGGTITAEHGMGRIRAEWLEREWGSAITGYMRRIKDAFDPRGILNPGVMFAEGGMLNHLRKYRR